MLPRVALPHEVVVVFTQLCAGKLERMPHGNFFVINDGQAAELTLQQQFLRKMVRENVCIRSIV